MINDNNRILIIEDDVPLATSINEYLTNEGFEVYLESNGSNAVNRIEHLQPDLVILDLMLPGKDGISICREVRPNFQGFILMFTAKEDEIDQIVGLEVGADDYLIKPIKPRLLLAKIKSTLRRKKLHGEHSEINQQLDFNDLNIDLRARKVMLSDEQLVLTASEYDLLVLLAKRAGEILSRDDIARHLTGHEYDGFDRTIDNKICNLRKKIGDDAKVPEKIKTIRSKGYVLVPAAFD